MRKRAEDSVVGESVNDNLTMMKTVVKWTEGAHRYIAKAGCLQVCELICGLQKHHLTWGFLKDHEIEVHC